MQTQKVKGLSLVDLILELTAYQSCHSVMEERHASDVYLTTSPVMPEKRESLQTKSTLKGKFAGLRLSET